MPRRSSVSTRPLNSSLRRLSHTITATPASNSPSTNGLLDTPRPITATRFPFNELKYSFSIESIDNRTSHITVLRAGPIPQIYIVAIIPHPNPFDNHLKMK